MSRNADLTGKLGLGGRPTITIGDVVLKINDSAKNMLQVMKLMGDEPTTEQVLESAGLLFEPGSLKALDRLDLNIQDYLTVIETAMEIITGESAEESGEGEAVTPDTTS